MAGSSQVLVAGAGPVGLTMALELARLGVAVRIVDKAGQRTDKSKALVVWPRTLELLEASGVADRFLAEGLRVTETRLFAGNRKLAEIPLALIASDHNFALFLPQSETERLLEEHLAGLGVAVERGVELASFSQDEASVAAVLAHPDGSREEAAFDWLLGCDGAHSTVRHALGATFSGEVEDNDWMLGDVLIDQGSGSGPALKPMTLTIFWHAEGLLVFFPITPERFRVVADFGPAASAGRREDPTLQDIQEVMDRRGPGGWRAHDPYWLAAFRINERQADRYRQGRVFLAGDAGHIHSPAGGQGMNTGMQDAVNLAWKLALVCHGQASPALLDSYGSERMPVAAAVIRAAGAGTRLATQRDPLRQRLRNTLASLLTRFTPVRRRFVNTLSEVTVAYPHSPLNGPAPLLSRLRRQVLPGERVPNARLDSACGEPSTLHRRLGAGRFLVVAVPGASRPDPAGQASFAARWGSVAEVVSLALDGRGRMGGACGALTLVRPDGYAALVTGPDNWKAVEEHLARLLGR